MPGMPIHATLRSLTKLSSLGLLDGTNVNPAAKTETTAIITNKLKQLTFTEDSKEEERYA